ncbi:MAG: hypothetical protein Q9P14_17640 [candidate division KSB1 bacterium]|nr:hypothetical protein [candidate division KSB1 bacterium]
MDHYHQIHHRLDDHLQKPDDERGAVLQLDQQRRADFRPIVAEPVL